MSTLHQRPDQLSDLFMAVLADPHRNSPTVPFLWFQQMTFNPWRLLEVSALQQSPMLTVSMWIHANEEEFNWFFLDFVFSYYSSLVL